MLPSCVGALGLCPEVRHRCCGLLLVLPMVPAGEYQGAAGGARSSLGKAGFAAAWAAGWAMSVEEAIRYALGEVAGG
jgi:hypothetical protein